MNIFTVMMNDTAFMQETCSVTTCYSYGNKNQITVSMHDLLMWRSSLHNVNVGDFTRMFPIEKFYEDYLKIKHKEDALSFFENELEHLLNLKSTTDNPLVLKMLEDQITMYSEALADLNKPVIDEPGSMDTGLIPFRFYDELEKRGVNVIRAEVSEPNIEDLKGLPTLKKPNNDAVKVLTGMYVDIHAMQTGNTKNPNHNAKWQTVLFNLEQLIEELKHVNNNA